MELSAQGTETLGMKALKVTKTLGDKETPSTKTFGNVIMQKLDNLDLDNDGTFFESVAEKVFTPEDLSMEPSTLYLNN